MTRFRLSAGLGLVWTTKLTFLLTKRTTKYLHRSSGMTFDLLCCQRRWPTYHLYHFAPYAFTHESVSLVHVHIACVKFNVSSSIRARTVSAYRLLHAMAIMSNSSLETASATPPVLWHPIQYVSLICSTVVPIAEASANT